jgi:hypothetical protein
MKEIARQGRLALPFPGPSHYVPRLTAVTLCCEVQVRAVWRSLMEVVPNAESACFADPDLLEAIIRPLGFHRFRARAIGAMSHDYLHMSWSRPSQLRYVGKYASDAYFIFCRCVQDLGRDIHVASLLACK